MSRLFVTHLSIVGGTAVIPVSPRPPQLLLRVIVLHTFAATVTTDVVGCQRSSGLAFVDMFHAVRVHLELRQTETKMPAQDLYRYSCRGVDGTSGDDSATWHLHIVSTKRLLRFLKMVDEPPGYN